MVECRRRANVVDWYEWTAWSGVVQKAKKLHPQPARDDCLIVSSPLVLLHKHPSNNLSRPLRSINSLRLNSRWSLKVGHTTFYSSPVQKAPPATRFSRRVVARSVSRFCRFWTAEL